MDRWVLKKPVNETEIKVERKSASEAVENREQQAHQQDLDDGSSGLHSHLLFECIHLFTGWNRSSVNKVT